MDKILDINKAMEIFDNDISLYKELMNSFLKKYPEYMEGIFKDIKNKNTQKLLFKAHRIKGMLQNLGADRASKMALILEESSAVGDYKKLGLISERLNRELINLKIFFLRI